MSAAVQINTWGGRTTPELGDDDLGFFCAAIEDRAGISLKPGKKDLIQTRLRSRLTVHGLESFKDYRRWLQELPKNDKEWEVFTNLLTTNKTDFFREPQHFEYLTAKILPMWLKSSQKRFKVWCAASSTGEEAYTLAMVLDRFLPKDRDYKILATDIDTNVLGTARNAVYSITKKSEIPVEYHQSCLDIGKNEASGWFRIKPRLKENILFKQHNLIERTAPNEETFDLILCRNVLIYFNQKNIDFVQRKLFGALKGSGHLCIGHSESFQGINHSWKSVGPSIFRKAL